jgi:hypothetical protein
MAGKKEKFVEAKYEKQEQYEEASSRHAQSFARPIKSSANHL